MKTSSEQLAAIRNHLRSGNRFEHKTVEQIRREMAETAASMPAIPSDTVIDQIKIGVMSGEWIRPSNTPREKENQAILYFHGGGFVAGTCDFYRDLCVRIAIASGVNVLNVEYRLAPEHPYPAANEDCMMAYRWLISNGYSPRNIVVGGDSVGGSLALMTLLALRDNGEELPAGACLISPHADLVHLDGESYRSRAELDPTGSLDSNTRIRDMYLGSHAEAIPLLSPLRMNLEGLCELFIQVGDHEVLLSDCTRLTERARAAGVKVELEVWENMWSVFHFLAYMLPEAQQAIQHIGRFVRSRLG